MRLKVTCHFANWFGKPEVDRQSHPKKVEELEEKG